MNLSNDLVEQFVKATNEEVKERQNETLYGTAVVFEGKMYARLDGSQQLTPIKTTTNIREGDRVIVSVQRHSAVVTGNISSPSASIEDLSDSHNNTIATCKELIAKKVSTDDLEAATARIGVLETDYAIINGNLEAANANITKLEANKLEAKSADLKYATIENLNATNANVKNLTANHAEFEKAVASDFEATNASIKKLDADKLNATDANLKYANIDFSNIKIAAIENLYATSGIIKDIVVSDQRITGTLVGVTITGDLIEGNTVVADKLVIKGSDGLYYKLNTDGITTEAQQTDYNSLNGSIIKAKSITATKVDVTDLVAFGATIGGLKIENGSIHSVSKDSASNTTRGLFFGKDGQAAIGDGTNFLKYFKDSDGNYKLAISADTITIKGGQKNLNTELDDINKKVNSVKSIKNTEVTYQAGTSGTTAPTGTWNKTIPSVANEQYLWSRTVTTYTDNSTSTVYSVSKMGVKGADGKNGTNATYITVSGSNYDTTTSNAYSYLIVNGQKYKFTPSRGHTLAIINPINSNIESIKSYDTYKSSIAMDTAISEVSTGKIICLFTYDAGALTQKARNALISCGSAITKTWDPGRYTHVFIGMKGLAKGNAYEEIATGSSATRTLTAYFTSSGIVLNGSKGETGLKALQANHNWRGTYTTINMTATAYTSDFNRTPVVGDVFTNLDGASNTGTWKVTAISGSSITIQLLSYVNSKGADGTSYWRKQLWIDLSASKYNQNTWYPVIGTALPYNERTTIEISVALNSGTKPTWSTHNNGFSVNLDIQTQASGWGTNNINTLIYNDQYSWCVSGAASPVSYKQLTNSSLPVIYLRGGGKYYVRSTYVATWTIQTETYTSDGQSVSPVSTRPTPDGTSVKGTDGKGIKSATITYQISGNATSIPTGTWVSSIPKTTVAAPYLWTKTVITYTDNTSSTAYSVGSSVDGVGVGGRNLIRGSGKLSTDYIRGDDTSVVTSGYNGAKAVATKVAWSGYYIRMHDIANRANLKAGDVVTMSIWVSTDSTTEVTSPDLYLYRANSGTDSPTKNFGRKKLKAGTWVQLSCTFTINADRKLQNNARFESSKDTTYNILWSAPKLELGNKATDWTPAPEDQVEKGKVVDEVNSELKIDGKSIALKTGHFTVDSKNLTLDSAGNATFSGKIKGASVEASTFNGGTFKGGTFSGNTFSGGTFKGGTFTGNEFEGGTFSGCSGNFKRGFTIGDASDPVFEVKLTGNCECSGLSINNNLDVSNNVDVGNNIDVGNNLTVNNNLTVKDTNILTSLSDMKSDISSINSGISGINSDIINLISDVKTAKSTADAAQATANNNPSWDAVNGKANTDTVKNVIKWRAQSRQLSLAANGEDYWNFWDLCSLDGYTRTAMIVSISGSASSYMMQYQHTYNNNGTQIRCRNFASWAFNGSIYVAVLYVHEGYC